MNKQDANCNDYSQASRRSFLRGALGMGGAAALTVAFGDTLTQTAYAATGTADRVLIVLSMRGAVDGLGLVVPHADPIYYQSRPNIAVPRESLLAQDAFFGMHPGLAPLIPLWNAKKLAAIHAAGQLVTTRSHFAAMEEVEDADPSSPARVGWLNRLAGLDGSGSPVEAIQFGVTSPSTAITGPEPALVAQNIDRLVLSSGQSEANRKARRASLLKAWAGSSGALGTGVRSALAVDEDFAAVRAGSATPANGAVYPKYSDLGEALKNTARTIRANVGAEIITVDHGSWDHHTDIGNLKSGLMKNKVEDFAAALAAFFQDLGPLADKVTLVTLSEFGRRIKENANWGLDHGHGTVMLAMGAGVKGGKYYGTWPKIENTVNADLPVTTDYRDVLAEVINTRFNASIPAVFPGLSYKPLGFMNA